MPKPKLEGGYWQIRIREDMLNPDGTRRRVQRRVTLGSKDELPTLKLAQRAAEPVLARVNSAISRPRAAVKFSEFCEKWKLAMLPEMKPSTQLAMRSNISKHLTPAFGERFLHELTPEMVQMFVAGLRRTASEKSVWNVVMTMRSIWRTAIDWGYTRERIFDYVRVRMKPPEGIQRCFTAEDVRRILAVAVEPFRTFCWLAAETGMRAGELCGLQWQDVDTELQVIHVRRSAWRGHLTAPKTRYGLRTIAVSDALLDRLKSMRGADDATAFVFHSRNQTPWDANLIQKRKLVPLLNALGIERAGFHAFRHFNSTAMNRAGTPSAAMRARLGHSSLLVTDRYTHNVAADEMVAAQAIRESIVPFCDAMTM